MASGRVSGRVGCQVRVFGYQITPPDPALNIGYIKQEKMITPYRLYVWSLFHNENTYFSGDKNGARCTNYR